MEEYKIGIYEKAVTSETNLYRVLDLFSQTKFDYLEISIDDNENRLSRLNMIKDDREKLRKYMNEKSLYIYSIVLSANRYYPIGTKDKIIRHRGTQIIKQAIDFAHDINIPIIQLAGYYSFFNDERDGKERERFIVSLKEVTEYASWKGIMLGLENMDGQDILSIEDSINILKEINSPWLQLYPDIGNLVANGLYLEQELKNITNHIISIHLKDARINEFRRVPFGEGNVNFKVVGEILRKEKYKGKYTIEMWNDGDDNSLNIIHNTLEYIQKEMDI